jgi:DNA repair photolyase
MILGLNDHELPALLTAAHDAGAQFATYSVVRLPGPTAPIFTDWLARHTSPTKAETVLARIRQSHQGQLNDARPLTRMRGDGPHAQQLAQLFKVTARKLGLDKLRPELTTTHFRRVQEGQPELF